MDSHHLVPINGNARKVTRKASIHDEFHSRFRAKNLGISYWSNAKPHIETPNADNFTDLTGTEFGRLKVIGYLGQKRWQCRCSCGYFVKRKSAVILKSLNDPSQMCPECYELCVLKRRDIQRRTSKPADWKSI
ncbi:hypothetical protein [Vibrio sp. TRT 29B02]|uniref:hypothetical protein n=1 Tax=Vibrio sp. TRT 29B02 TaxID=3418508 RepID=UPI003CF0A071